VDASSDIAAPVLKVFVASILRNFWRWLKAGNIGGAVPFC
jgi:hypothetical protein